MAVVAVTADNNRVEDGEAVTGWSNIGGGAGVSSEPSFPYQGSNCANRKITSATGAGFYYDPTADGGSAVDMTASNRTTLMVKAIVTDYRGLDATDGVLIRIGSGTGDYYAFVIAGSDSPAGAFAAYKAVGGWFVVAIDPNENATYNDTGKDAGSPVLTAVDYFGGVFAFTASTAKNENCGLDALDVGSGLYLVGGDGGDTDGVWQDFVDEDEGTVANRWGYARNGEDGTTILLLGNLRIGTDDDTTSTATEFTDTDAVILWLDHLAAAGFSVATIDLGNASTVVEDGSTHIGIGDTTNVDSRPDYVVTGTSGSLTFNGQLNNFRNVTFTSACTVVDAAINCALLTQGSADISDCVITTNSLTSVACLQDPTFGVTTDLHDVTFIQGGAGHALEIDTAGTYTLTNITFSGYGADTTDSAAIDVTASSGTVTINWSGGTAPTYKTAGATVIIQNSVTVKVTARDATDTSTISGARVYVEADTGGPLPSGDSVTITRSGTTATVTHTAHGLSTGDKVKIRGADQSDYNLKTTVTVTGVNTYTYTVANSPTTPATGTITSTAVILDGDTDGSGVNQDTGFPFTSNQPAIGRVRKGTTSPLYKSALVSGTITADGLDVTAFLVPDE